MLNLFFPALILAAVNLGRPYATASASMAPTLQVGDQAFVSPYSAADSHARPEKAIRPARGDIIAFIPTKGSSLVFFKRIMGFPGERIQMKLGQLYINDQLIARESAADFVGQGVCGMLQAASVKQWHESLPNGVSYNTLDCMDGSPFDDTEVFTVPDGQVFVVGDSRDNSVDSRMQSQMGYVPFDRIIGRLDRIVPGQ